MRRGMKIYVALALLLSLLFAAGCGPKSTPSEKPAESAKKAAAKEELVVALEADLTMVDPNMHVNTPENNVLSHVYDTLVRADDKLQIQPSLAESWETSQDSLTWTFKLKAGVKFHDGKPFTAADVKYTIERIINPQQKSPQAYRLTPVKAVTVVNDTTVQIATKAPFPTLLYELAQTQIVQNNAVPIGEKITKPIGTGPYKFVEWRKDDRVLLEANADYWGGTPKFKKLTFRIIPETATRANELRAGTVDVVKNLTPSDMKAFADDKSVKLYSVPSFRLMYLGFRTDDQGIPQAVRQAIAMAIDRESLTKFILEGQAQPATTLVSPAAFGFSSSLKPFPYDPEKAKQMVKDAGWAGHKVRMDSTNGKYPGDAEVAKAIADSLTKIGLVVDLQILEYATYLKNVNDKPEIYLFAWGQPEPDADAALYRNFHSSSKPRMRYANPQVDTLLDTGRGTLDKAKRQDAYNQVQEVLKNDAPWIPLYFLNFTAGVRTNVEGVQVLSSEAIWLDKAGPKE